MTAAKQAHPHPRGGTWYKRDWIPPEWGTSPPAWGNRGEELAQRRAERHIPTRVGEPLRTIVAHINDVKDHLPLALAVAVLSVSAHQQHSSYVLKGARR
jgi:hypothetical protein